MCIDIFITFTGCLLHWTNISPSKGQVDATKTFDFISKTKGPGSGLFWKGLYLLLCVFYLFVFYLYSFSVRINLFHRQRRGDSVIREEPEIAEETSSLLEGSDWVNGTQEITVKREMKKKSGKWWKLESVGSAPCLQSCVQQNN